MAWGSSARDALLVLVQPATLVIINAHNGVIARTLSIAQGQVVTSLLVDEWDPYVFATTTMSNSLLTCRIDDPQTPQGHQPVVPFANSQVETSLHNLPIQGVPAKLCPLQPTGTVIPSKPSSCHSRHFTAFAPAALPKVARAVPAMCCSCHDPCAPVLCSAVHRNNPLSILLTAAFPVPAHTNTHAPLPPGQQCHQDSWAQLVTATTSQQLGHGCRQWGAQGALGPESQHPAAHAALPAARL